MGEYEFIGEHESTERESTERCKWRSLPRVHSTASVPDTVPEAEREYTTKLLTSFPEAPASLLFFGGGGQGPLGTRSNSDPKDSEGSSCPNFRPEGSSRPKVFEIALRDQRGYLQQKFSRIVRELDWLL